jgi:hypothetical protein
MSDKHALVIDAIKAASVQINVCKCTVCEDAGSFIRPARPGTIADTILTVMADGNIWNAAQLARYGWGVMFCDEVQDRYYADSLRPKITKGLHRLVQSKRIVKVRRGQYRLPSNNPVKPPEQD